MGHHHSTLASEHKHYQGVVQLRSVFTNKGTGFTKEEREENHLEGLLPFRAENVEEQCARHLEGLRKRSSNIEKFHFLNSLKQSNVKLYYRLLIDHVKEIAPLVYTPTVGDVCLQYSHNFINPEGLYINKFHRGHIKKIVDNWPHKEVDIIVVSDGSRILGLGDLGVNGMGIPVGKLALYVTCAGFDPIKTLPVIVDIGTNTQAYLDDPFYLGIKEKRIEGEEYLSFMDEFMAAVTHRWPKILVQFEDFATPYCFDFLERYRKKYLCFNDDIQGTGAVILSGFMNALKASKQPLESHRLVFFGAGSAGTGVCDEIVKLFIKEGKMSEEEARSHFWLVDSKGLVTLDRGDELAHHKIPFARKDNQGRQITSLLETIEFVKPTALFGLSVQPGAFNQEAIQKMAELNERPIIFPLSNPTSKSECTFAQALEWTGSKVLFAAGSPFDPIEKDGKIYTAGQGNNMYIFPGLGLGAVLAETKMVSDEMIYAASKALADSVTEEQLESGLLYPPLTQIREISAKIAVAVIKMAIAEHLSQNSHLKGKSDEQLLQMVKESMYDPRF